MGSADGATPKKIESRGQAAPATNVLRKTTGAYVARTAARIFHFANGEWCLEARANGGDVILMRTAQVAAELYAAALLARNALDPSRTLTFSWAELGAEVVATLPWLGAIVGAVYAAFYARFSAQWSYLASVYHQIKQAEANLITQSSEATLNEERIEPDVATSNIAIAEWKAGFIEDADTLHLARKPAFASTIRAWGGVREVREAFGRYSPGGIERLNLLLEIAEHAYQTESSKWVKPGVLSGSEPACSCSPDKQS